MRPTWPEIRYNFFAKQKSIRFRGIEVPLDHALVGWPVVKRLIRGSYEAPELNALLALAQPGDTVVELGGGAGVVSSVIANSVPNCKVVTFEANPNMLSQIRSVHAANNLQNIELRHGIVLPGTSQQKVPFFVHESFAESGQKRNASTVLEVQVEAHSWSALIDELRPTALLCDIEGGEVELLPTLDFSGIRSVVVELHPKVTSAAEIGFVFKQLLNQGFSPRIDLFAGTVFAFERIE